METTITKQLLAFLETNNFLFDYQYGFRQARSTGDLLAYAVRAWSSALESYGESRVISLDISNAFDPVCHKGLLAKLPMFALNKNLIKWIASFFLTDHLQLGSTASSLDLILSTLVYLRALLSCLFYSFSSETTYFPLYFSVFNLLLMKRI